MEMRTYREAGPSISLLGLGCMRLPKVCPDKDDIDFAAAPGNTHNMCVKQ